MEIQIAMLQKQVKETESLKDDMQNLLVENRQLKSELENVHLQKTAPEEKLQRRNSCSSISLDQDTDTENKDLIQATKVDSCEASRPHSLAKAKKMTRYHRTLQMKIITLQEACMKNS
jgi:regulator of replication initiation timing